MRSFLGYIETRMSLIDHSVDAGNTVILSEHPLDAIRQADWIIDLGPEGCMLQPMFNPIKAANSRLERELL